MLEFARIPSATFVIASKDLLAAVCLVSFLSAIVRASVWPLLLIVIVVVLTLTSTAQSSKPSKFGNLSRQGHDQVFPRSPRSFRSYLHRHHRFFISAGLVALLLQLDSRWKPCFATFISSLVDTVFSTAVAIFIAAIAYTPAASNWTGHPVEDASALIARGLDLLLLAVFGCRCTNSSSNSYVRCRPARKSLFLKRGRLLNRLAIYKGLRRPLRRQTGDIDPDARKLPRKSPISKLSTSCEPVPRTTSQSYSSEPSCTATTMSSSSDIVSTPTPPPPSSSAFLSVDQLRQVFWQLPPPGQPGAPYFAGENISHVLDDFEEACDTYGGYSDERKCSLFPTYCTPQIRESVKALPGYLNRAWPQLKDELKHHYWEHDAPKYSLSALRRLIEDAKLGKLGLLTYVAQYDAMSRVLLDQHSLTKLDRCAYLLDGLSEIHRSKVIDFCVNEDWRLSTRDASRSEPDYDRLQEFVLREGRRQQIRSEYEAERSLREASSTSALPATATSTGPVTTAKSVSFAPGIIKTSGGPAPAPAPATDPMAELTRQFEHLTLLVQSALQPGTGPTPTPPRQSQRNPNCIYCDQPGHLRRNCSAFNADMTDKIIYLNEQNHVASSKTRQPYPLMSGKGGIKRLVDAERTYVAPPAVNTRNITLDSDYAHLGNGTLMRTTLDFDKGTRIEEIIDVDVEEKRRADREFPRRVRPRTTPDSDVRTPTPLPPMGTRAHPSPDTEMSDEPPVQPYRRRDPPIRPAQPPANSPEPPQPPQPTVEPQRKFKLASELSKTISAADVADKIMDSEVQLTIREILAVSKDVAGSLHERTKLRRTPIDVSAIEYNAYDDNAAEPVGTPSVKVNSIAAPSAYYALPSGRAKVLINSEFLVSATLDSGSEVNVMPRRIFAKMGLPIDDGVSWRINAFNSEQEAKGPKVSPSELVGVCHDVLVDIGGVAVKQHIFVVEHCNADLLLGRPWERAVCASAVNMDNGELIVTIRSPDGRREAKFVAAHAEHERNRRDARSEGEILHRQHHLKV